MKHLAPEGAGSNFAEYALMIAIVAIVSIGSLIFFGSQIAQILIQSGTAPGG